MKFQIRGMALPLILASTVLWSASAQSQTTVSTPLSAAVQTNGMSGGPQSSACGYIPTTPSQTVRVTESFASLNVSLQGEGSLTLLIQGPNGFNECRKTDQFNAGQISAPGVLDQGTYSLYVGNESTAQTPYTLSISQN
ncbi:MAG TPA: hypothetical protein V6D29_17110 [Leptolyngbyaceae cyanobacterium]